MIVFAVGGAVEGGHWGWAVLGLLSVPALVALNAFFVAAEFAPPGEAGLIGRLLTVLACFAYNGSSEVLPDAMITTGPLSGLYVTVVQ